MSRAWVLFVATVFMTTMPTLAHAQRGARGSVNTPYGSFSAAEMRAAGGNPIVAEQNREMKQMTFAQRQIDRQQKQILQKMAQQQKASQNATKPGAAKNVSAASASPRAAATLPKNGSTKSTTTAAPKTATPTAPKTAKPTKPHVPGAPVD